MQESIMINCRQQEGIRINKYLSEAGYCSRREADRLILAGRVRVDGQAAELGTRVILGQEVLVDDLLVIPEEKKLILAVHKPRGVVCTTDRRWGDPLLEDLIREEQRVYPIGRLDKDSSGLILMTNQGDILNKILKSQNAHEKEYIVTVDHEISGDFLKKLRAGVYLEELDRTTDPCKAERMGHKTLRIILTQGLNRQIRRMCETLGYHVVNLKRVRIMNIRLGDLPSGTYRALTKDEEEELFLLLKDSRNERKEANNE